jgi:5-methylcytosine-specific restriction endonuclease McrA
MSSHRPESARVKKTLKKRLLKKQGGHCADCGGTGTGKSGRNPLEPHHIIPVSRGGETKAHNLVIVCRACHVRRHQQ